jgi:uncharacterized protein with von Willebrand factor type A (vWA) domain
MSAYDPKAVLIMIFTRLCASGFRLGVGELLDALRAVEGGWGSAGRADLEQVAQLLWCHSRSEAREFAVIWSSVASERDLATGTKNEVEPPSSRLEHGHTSPPEDRSFGAGLPSGVATAGATGRSEGWAALPVRAPERSAPGAYPADLEADGPISRRAMVYAWRQLRRPSPDGPEDVLDVDATIVRASRLGFYLAPVYRRREHNHAHLVLMLDQGGSMTPFHRFTRDLVETARHESTLRQVDVLYFHNVPTASLFLDPHLTDPVSWSRLAAQSTADTGVLLVSDAGAARGYRRPDRVRASGDFLARLSRQTSLVAWLNPMPRDRWSGTSARIIAGLVPMFPMDPEGLGHAVDVLRGLLLPHSG